jgi:hypothetical protein
LVPPEVEFFTISLFVYVQKQSPDYSETKQLGPISQIQLQSVLKNHHELTLSNPIFCQPHTLQLLFVLDGK